MKTLKVLLQEVVSGIKAWVNSNFAQESNTVHKTGNETINGSKTFTNDGHFNNVYPNSPTTYNLGTSSYKWNNGWINNAEVNYIGLHSDIKTKGVVPSDSGRHNTSIFFRDSNNAALGKFEHNLYNSGDNELLFQVLNCYSNGSLDPNGTEYDCSVRLQLTSTGQRNFAPTEHNLINLGTTTRQWKTFNGVNPGALSLPNGSVSESIEVDITDWYIQDPDYPNDPTKQIIDDSTTHNVTSSVPGWVKITFPNVSGNYAYARKYQAGGNLSHTRIADGIASDIFPNITLIFPIESSLVTRVKAKSASVRIFPCLGNV